MSTMEIQTSLKALGFDPGPLDGKMGPLTRSAIKAYQESRGLVVDGIPGTNTQTSLLKDAGSRQSIVDVGGGSVGTALAKVGSTITSAVTGLWDTITGKPSGWISKTVSDMRPGPKSAAVEEAARQKQATTPTIMGFDMNTILLVGAGIGAVYLIKNRGKGKRRRRR